MDNLNCQSLSNIKSQASVTDNNSRKIARSAGIIFKFPGTVADYEKVLKRLDDNSIYKY